MPIDWDSDDDEPSIYDYAEEIEMERKAAVEQAIVYAMLQWRQLKREFGLN